MTESLDSAYQPAWPCPGTRQLLLLQRISLICARVMCHLTSGRQRDGGDNWWGWVQLCRSRNEEEDSSEEGWRQLMCLTSWPRFHHDTVTSSVVVRTVPTEIRSSFGVKSVYCLVLRLLGSGLDWVTPKTTPFASLLGWYLGLVPDQKSTIPPVQEQVRDRVEMPQCRKKVILRQTPITSKRTIVPSDVFFYTNTSLWVSV